MKDRSIGFDTCIRITDDEISCFNVPVYLLCCIKMGRVSCPVLQKVGMGFLKQGIIVNFQSYHDAVVKSRDKFYDSFSSADE